MKKIHLICNAHLDPVWQWEWEEGAAEAISTFRTAVKFCEEYDTYVFNHNEALLYRWILEYEPELFEKIKELVNQGKWHIMGGWHLQPDCNMPSGESFVRQIRSGRKFFAEHFGVVPTTAINFDSFGHNRGLVQILKKSGYDSYMFHRPSKDFITLPADTFRWRGFDGSEILAVRTNGYGSHYGQVKERIDSIINATPDGGTAACLWGVGDHGGGASRPDLDMIEQMKTEYSEKGIELVHSTPEEYFADVKADELPVFDDELNPWAPGCYTSIVRIKQQHRRLENMLFSTERMAACAFENNLMREYPYLEFEDAEYDLLTAEFHDVLPGSCIQAGEESSLRQLSHGEEIVSRIRARAFFALSGGQKKSEKDKIPVLVYNHHPFPVELDVECEMILWDQNWENNFSYPQIYSNDIKLPTQCVKERSCLNLDWRKKVIFHTILEPMQMNRFDCAYEKIPERPAPVTIQTRDAFILSNPTATVEISKKTGLISSWKINGTEFLGGECEAIVMADDCDPWGMNVTSFTEKIGSFTLLSKEKCKEFCGISADIEPVHCIESGNVKTTVEAMLGWNDSKLIVNYSLSKFSNDIEIKIRAEWAETQKMLKFSVPSVMNNPELRGQVAYGEQVFPRTGRENVAQRYVYFNDGNSTLGIINNGIYGFSANDNTLLVTLMHSAAYCAHPIGDRDIIPQNRYTPYMEQGERLFELLLTAGDNDVSEDIPRKAAIFNEQPMALAFYPPEEKKKPVSLVDVSGDKVEIPAIFKDENDGIVVRIFNPFSRKAETVLTFSLYKKTEKIILNPYEIKTLRVTTDNTEEISLA